MRDKLQFFPVLIVDSYALFDIEVGTSNRGSGTVYKLSNIIEASSAQTNVDLINRIKNTLKHTPLYQLLL